MVCIPSLSSILLAVPMHSTASWGLIDPTAAVVPWLAAAARVALGASRRRTDRDHYDHPAI